MKPEIGNLLKQAQKMQTEMQAAQKKIAEMTIIGEAGGGLLKIEMDGNHQCKKTMFDKSLLEEEPEFIADIITAAINNATDKIKKTSSDAMSKLTAGMQLPPGFGG